MDGLVEDLKRIVARKDSADDHILMNSKYIPFILDVKNFHSINALAQETAKGTVLFVDGGNSILFESAAFCIGIIRVAGIIYSDNKRIRRDAKEFYISVKETSGKYHVKTYPKNSFDGMIFDPEDEALRSGVERCNTSRVVSVIRRFAEIEYATDNSTGVDYIVMDGTLEARYPSEDTYLEKMFAKANVCAISKTCTLTTKNGYGIIKKLSDMAKDSSCDADAWYYAPIVESRNPMHKAELYFVKLHNDAGYVFRLEVQKGFKGDIQGLFSLLKTNSVDPIFLGYPYGLIDVDQYARISEQESRILQTKISARLGKDWNELSKHLTSTNAHSILDKIRF